MLVVVVELPNDEVPNVILEKGVVLVLNTELFDWLDIIVDVTTVSLTLEVGCAIAEPNRNEEPVPTVVAMVDEGVFEMEFVVVVTAEIVFLT